MKKTSLLALLAVAGSSAAFAAPRESITLTNVPSIARQGDPTNFSTTLVATGSDGGGAYTAQSLNVSGAIGSFRGASWQREPSIRVTPPSGTPFNISPFTLNTSTAGSVTNHLTIPVSAVTTAGTWTFEFFDNYDDATSASGTNASEATLGLYDAVWSTVTIALDDVAPAAPTVGSGPSVTYTNVPSDALVAASTEVRTWTNATSVPGTVLGVRIRGQVVNLNGNGDNTPLNAPGNVRINVLPPGAGSPTAAWAATDLNISSMGTVDSTLLMPTGTASVGNWSFTFGEGNNSTLGTDNLWLNVSFELVDSSPVAPTSIPVPALVDGSFVSASGTVSGTTPTWFSITVPAISNAAGSALDIDMVGTTLTPSNDPRSSIYGPAGTSLFVNDDGGPGLTSLYSFGRGSRVGRPDGATAADQNFTGQTAATLAAGTYYMAVTGGTTTWSANFSPVVTAANSGNVTVNVRYYSNFVVTAPASEDLGTLVANATVTDSEAVPANTVKWYKFTLNDYVSRANNRSLSIDNEGSTTTPVNDSWLALYTDAGVVRATDAADGSNAIAMLTFGADNRPATPTPTVGLPYNGADGVLVPGVYYIATGAGTIPSTIASNYLVSGISATASATNLVTNVRYASPGVTLPSVADPAGTIDVGNVGSATSPSEAVITRTWTGFTTESAVQWYKFTTLATASDATGFYLEVDTEGTDPTATNAALADTECGIYASNGLFLITDDDDGSGNRSQFSFGDTSPVRPDVVTGGAAVGVARNGRDGALPAGTYYLVVGFDPSTYPSATTSMSQFVVTSPTSGAVTGEMVVNWRTNLPLPPAQCGPSDVAGPNQSVGADNSLTADDIIVFLGWFFANDARADVAGPNQSIGADGSFTADDIIVFLGRYFAGC